MAARTKTNRNKGFTIRTVKTKDDRRRPSVFLRLKTEEAFKGVALFEPDPELDDNPGYFEYYDHYDKQGNAYVPCTGDKCPFCAANDNPSTRALTVWYFPAAADVKDKIKVFTMNYSTTQEISDESEDEGGILGRVVRIKRLSDKGDYRVKITTDKKLTAKELKEAMKLLAEKFPDGLPALVERQLAAQMERLKALDALDDDGDDDEDDDEGTTTTARRGKSNSTSRKKKEEEEEEDDDDEEEEDEEEEEEEGDDEEDDDSDDDDDDDDDEEDDDEEDDDDDDDEEEEDEEEEESDEISGAVYEVVKVQEKDEIFDLKAEDGTKAKMWLGDGVEVDYDEVKKGVKVKIDAAKDAEDDWIITAISLDGAKKTTTRRRTTKK